MERMSFGVERVIVEGNEISRRELDGLEVSLISGIARD